MSELDRFLGVPLLPSDYVPRLECFEADYSKSLIRRLLEGRTTDLREWEEDQIFLVGDVYTMRPETFDVIRGLEL